MSLLKLCYFAHGSHLGKFKKPLFKNKIEAWKFGPVIPDVYYSFRNQGMTPTQLISGYSVDVDNDIFLEKIYEIYGHMSPFRMSKLTHVKGGPWDLTMKMSGLYSIILNDLIQVHFIAQNRNSQL